MIVISDVGFQKTVLAGTVTLDRAKVVVIGIDLRENRGGSPGIRADIAYGIESGGKFQAFDYNSIEATIPFYVEPGTTPGRFDDFQTKAVTAKGKPFRGTNLMESLTEWLESELVAAGNFGAGASVS